MAHTIAETVEFLMADTTRRTDPKSAIANHCGTELTHPLADMLAVFPDKSVILRLKQSAVLGAYHQMLADENRKAFEATDQVLGPLAREDIKLDVNLAYTTGKQWASKGDAGLPVRRKPGRPRKT